jgi:hypothetical protein
MSLGGGGEPCALCARTVYSAERLLTSAGTLFHSNCFRCTVCERLLHRATYCQDAATGRLYCKPHYSQLAAKAGLHRMASGGVDASAGVLWRKRRKAADQEELECLSVGSAVWIDLALAPPPKPGRPGLSRAPSSASLLRPGFEDIPSSVIDLAERLGADARASPFVKAIVVRTGAEGGTVAVRAAEEDEEFGQVGSTACATLARRLPMRIAHSLTVPAYVAASIYI